MHDDKWDEEMRKLFNEVEGEYDPASWEKLSERMDAMDDDEADELFDHTVKGKLEPFEVSSKPQWEQMEAALITHEERRKKVIASKSLEGIILLLVFFTLWNYRSHTVTDVSLDNAYVHTVKAESEIIENVIADINHTPATQASISSASKEVTTAVFAQKKAAFYNNLISDYLNPVESVSKVSASFVRRDIDELKTASIKISELPSAPIAVLDTNFELLRQPSAVAIDVMGKKDNPYNGWRAGIAQSYDVAFVNSDITLGYLGDQISSGLSGHSTMIVASHRLGAVDIGSGLGYSAKSFAPGLHTKYQKASANSASFLQSQLDKISFKQIHIPLSVKLYAAPKHKTSFYIVAGAVANVILETDYDIRRTIQSNARPSADPRANIIDLDRPPLGLGNGGTIKDNFYATGLIGFGVESYLSNGISWFIQPQYQHTFSTGINEVANEINTLSFSAGLSFTL